VLQSVSNSTSNGYHLYTKAELLDIDRKTLLFIYVYCFSSHY